MPKTSGKEVSSPFIGRECPFQIFALSRAFSAALTAVQVAPAPGKPPPSGPARAGDLPPGPPLDVPPTLQRIRTAVSPMPEQGSQPQAAAPGKHLTVRASVNLHAQSSMTWQRPRHQGSQCLCASLVAGLYASGILSAGLPPLPYVHTSQSTTQKAWRFVCMAVLAG